VLTDLMLPGMNGSEICAKIRETSTIPIILMTAADSDEAQLQAFKMGADDYVSKPFNPKLMVARVVAHLRRVYRYDITPEEESVSQTREQVELIPAGWIGCEYCGYMGPREKFETTNRQGQRSVMCPNCKQGDQVSYSVG
jgi:DNA-binding NarL/FixJ family response regulator